MTTSKDITLDITETIQLSSCGLCLLMIFLYVEITFNCTRLILLNKIEKDMKLNAGGQGRCQLALENHKSCKGQGDNNP